MGTTTEELPRGHPEQHEDGSEKRQLDRQRDSTLERPGHGARRDSITRSDSATPTGLRLAQELANS